MKKIQATLICYVQATLIMVSFMGILTAAFLA